MITNKFIVANFKVIYQLGLGIGLGLFAAVQLFSGFGVLGIVALGLGGIFAFDGINSLKSTGLIFNPPNPNILPLQPALPPDPKLNPSIEPKVPSKSINLSSEPPKSMPDSGQQGVPALNLGSMFLPAGSKGSLRRNSHRHRLSQQPLKDDILSAREMTTEELSELMQESARDLSTGKRHKKQ
jgi:hypothetical protein